MIPDFFTSKTLRQRVRIYCRYKKFITSIDLENLKDDIKRREGIVKGLFRIPREARQLRKDGELRRLDRAEKILLNYNPKFVCYEWIGENGR